MRSLRMKTVPSLMDIQYEEWVEGNRNYVDKISEGKIAYVHMLTSFNGNDSGGNVSVKIEVI